MKIAILSFYSGLADRGVETWAQSVKEKVKSYDIQILGGEKYENNIDLDNKHYIYWQFLILRHAISTLLVWIRYDIVVPTNGTVQTLICRVVTFFYGKKMIVFGHSGPGADDKFNLLCSPNVFVAFSSSQADWVNKYKLPWTKVVVIPHAVDTSFFKPAKRKVEENVVLCVAANIPDKRVGLVREAVERITDARFMAVGSGNKFRYPHSKMPEVYQRAKVFCFVPKSHEAFGLVFLEAMASNLPIVTIDDPVRREIVGEAGVFVADPQNVIKLVEGIKFALKRNWGNIPRRQAEWFSWVNVSSKYEELFKS
ncbi:MAG TPA: glycosyltransferase family 4 protein [Patescibacteria group bacterium]